MKKALILCALGALIVPASASATVSPEKQAQLNARGWSVSDDPISVTADKSGRNCERARVGSSLDNANHNPMVYGRINPFLLCANGGKITHHYVEYHHGSPGQGWKAVTTGPLYQHSYWMKWGGCSCRMFRSTYHLGWRFGSVNGADSWDLLLVITGWVRAGSDHNLTFNKTVKWE